MSSVGSWNSTTETHLILITSRSKGNICKYIFFELFSTHSFTISNSNLFYKGKRTSILGLCTTKEAIGQPDGICCRAIGTRGVKGAIPSPPDLGNHIPKQNPLHWKTIFFCLSLQIFIPSYSPVQLNEINGESSDKNACLLSMPKSWKEYLFFFLRFKVLG